VSYEDRKATWNSCVRKEIRRGSAEEVMRKHPGIVRVCVLLCFIKPILGNRYGPGVPSCQQTSDSLGWPDSHPAP